MVRVHIDNDTYVDVTPDHKFILKDLSLKMAKDLTN
jgi:intein/homing endonuclease